MMKTLYKEMSSLIETKVRNPSNWMLAIREIVELFPARPASIIPMDGSSLETTCYSVINSFNPMRDEKKMFQVSEALKTWKERHSHE